MAEIDLPVQPCNSSGTILTVYDSSTDPALSVGSFSPLSGDQFVVPNDGKTKLHIQRGGSGGSSSIITVQTVATMDGLAFDNKSFTVPGGARACFGPFRKDVYGDPFKFALNNVSNNLRISVMSEA